MASRHAAAVLSALAEKAGGKVAPMKEDAVQRAVFQHLAARAMPGVVAFAVPNGGVRSRSEAARMNGCGVTAGVPDILAVSGGKLHALELKRAAGGHVSDAQSAMLARLEAAGAVVAVAHGLDAAIETLERWGILRPAARLSNDQRDSA